MGSTYSRFEAIGSSQKTRMKLFGVALVSLALLVASCYSDSCGGNCPSGGCDECICGTSASYVDISEWCSKHSWDQSCCECIVQNESGGNANALYQNDGGIYPDSYDLGLWAINDFNWDECNRGTPPCDPADNLECAKDVYRWGGNTWENWSTCSKCGCCDSP